MGGIPLPIGICGGAPGIPGIIPGGGPIKPGGGAPLPGIPGPAAVGGADGPPLPCGAITVAAGPPTPRTGP